MYTVAKFLVRRRHLGEKRFSTILFLSLFLCLTFSVHAQADYADIIDSGRFPFPVGEAARDARLRPSALVVGVVINEVARAYPVENLIDPINDEVGTRSWSSQPKEEQPCSVRLSTARRCGLSSGTGISWMLRPARSGRRLESPSLAPAKAPR